MTFSSLLYEADNHICDETAFNLSGFTLGDCGGSAGKCPVFSVLSLWLPSSLAKATEHCLEHLSEAVRGSQYFSVFPSSPDVYPGPPGATVVWFTLLQVEAELSNFYLNHFLGVTVREVGLEDCVRSDK